MGWEGPDGLEYKNGFGRMIQDTRLGWEVGSDTRMGWEEWFRYKDEMGIRVQDTRMGLGGCFRIQGWVWEDDSGYKDGFGRMFYKVELGSRFRYKDGWEEWFRIQGWVGKKGSGYKDGW